MTSSQVTGLSGLAPGQNLFAIKEKEIIRNLLLHPRIKSAAMSRRLPGKIILTVEERLAVAAIPATGVFWYIDRDGTFLEEESVWNRDQVTLITGLPLPAVKPAPGSKISLPGMDSVLAVVNLFSPEVRQVVQEVHFGGAEGDTLYTKNGTRVYLGQPEDLEKKLTYFWAIYRQHVENGRLSQLVYIDVSYPMAPTLRYGNEGE